MPIDGDARFDGRPAGWLVCPPGSAHRPTVSRRARAGAVPAAARLDRIHALNATHQRSRRPPMSDPTVAAAQRDSTSRSTCSSATPRAPPRPPSSTTTAALQLRRAGRARAPHGRRPARAGPAPRRARAAADAGLQRLAGELPRRDVRRPGAGGGEHPAHRRRLCLHARALARAGGAGVGRAAAGADRGAGQGRPRSAQGHRLAPGRAAARRPRSSSKPSSPRRRRWPSRPPHAGRRPGLLALFVRLHRPPQGHRALARQPLLDGRAVRHARAAACAKTTSASRPPSCSSPTAWAMR